MTPNIKTLSCTCDVIQLFLIDLQFDGIYQSWIYGNTKLVIDRPTMPAIESSIIHFMSLEEQVSRLMEDYKKRSSQFTPPRQIQYMREPLTMTQFNKLLK
ncbi:21747_t:CDS:2 [Entrophospora sp. SA101]|nr:21747_t:CDS:2 [Entrophospora sp. SA101]